jgi:hypothetical protein
MAETVRTIFSFWPVGACPLASMGSLHVTDVLDIHADVPQRSVSSMAVAVTSLLAKLMPMRVVVAPSKVG